MRPRGPLAPLLISRARGRQIAVARDQRTGRHWVYDRDSRWVAGTFDVLAVLPASEQRDEYLLAGALEPDYLPTRSAQMVIVYESLDSQLCRIHRRHGVWVSMPRRYIDGGMIRLTWTDLDGHVLDRYELSLSRDHLFTGSSGYLPFLTGGHALVR